MGRNKDILLFLSSEIYVNLSGGANQLIALRAKILAGEGGYHQVGMCPKTVDVTSGPKSLSAAVRTFEGKTHSECPL